MNKTLVASGLLVVALAALLVAWFTSGWADVRARQNAKRTAPLAVAETRGAELAQELRRELSRLLSREIERPYFHYQNLMRDPRASRGTGVTPSPLATGPNDPLVMGYFQLDTKGKTTTPTINDDVPALSEPKQLAGNLQFRGEVIRSLSVRLAPIAVAGELIARTDPPVEPQQTQVITLDNDSYQQNSLSNQIYQQNVPTQAVAPLEEPTSPPRPQPALAPAPTPALPETVTIIVSPLEWRTLPFAGVPTLVAVREVATPDGALAQGFVVERASLTSFLASNATDTLVELRPSSEPGEPRMEIAPGWHLAVAAHPGSLAQATADAAQIGSAFILRFILIGIIAALAASLVVWLVARAEKLARERSQFAAAAAHELRTPLAGLQLYGDMLAEGLGDPAKQRDYARRMSEEASRLGRVVSNVLGFSQLERGNLSVDAKVARLDEELRILCERAEPALDRAGAALALDVAPDLTARFDRDALARIVGNLLDNAEKYGRDAENRTIGLSARAQGDGVEVVVTDHGPGIAPSARAKLFRPFSRGVSADGPAGLGLGLALSQSLARAMGGDLEYRATADGGAAFVLRLAPG